MSGSARMCSGNEFHAAGPACERYHWSCFTDWGAAITLNLWNIPVRGLGLVRVRVSVSVSVMVRLGLGSKSI